MSRNAFSLEWYGSEEKAAVMGVCEQAVKDSGARVEATAKRLVPKRTKGLAGSIEARSWKSKAAVGCMITAGEKGREHIAVFAELGTPGDVYKGPIRKGQKRTPIEAKPYLRPALRRERRKFLKRFDGALK